ncbi:hypothetical protein [Phycicoccus sonneratiae]|uniref:Uncharacterized protein n=1 Tax=Phycicoccus sonneratiae TaxID=2807628 RepID=A0ABS2CKH9_9MICO|nr:hypothetical protein [Phycicoccus sonneraticus]MBM6400343.1 hypothetical protein [Phycicoccus sonneraticus]
MTGVQASVSVARDRVAYLRLWADHVVTNWDVYAGDHHGCDGFVDLRSEVVAARDAVRGLATTIERRLDDSGWVGTVGDRTREWNQAASHVSDAQAAVAEPALRAIGSWRRGASPRYRAAAPPQRTALSTVHEACLDMKRGCTSLETAGEAHFESVSTLATTLTQHLTYQFHTSPGFLSTGPGSQYSLLTPPPVMGPESPVQESEVTGTQCVLGTLHVSATEVESRFVTPRETAETALTTADDTLRTAVTNAFSEPAPRRPGPQLDGDYGRITIAQRFGTWPVPGTVA